MRPSKGPYHVHVMQPMPCKKFSAGNSQSDNRNKLETEGNGFMAFTAVIVKEMVVKAMRGTWVVGSLSKNNNLMTAGSLNINYGRW